MARAQNPNLEILILAVDQLGTLTNDMVFLGGCATGLLITDPAAPPIRVTRDVDAIVQVYSQAEYYRLAEKLRARGFNEDTRDDAPICRWISGDVVLDVMPTNPETGVSEIHTNRSMAQTDFTRGWIWNSPLLPFHNCGSTQFKYYQCFRHICLPQSVEKETRFSAS